MKYCVVIMDGAAGLPIKNRDGKTCLELAETPNLDALTREGMLGLTDTIPAGMEPSSACACMSILGYDPAVYYSGRAGIEAKSLGVPIGKNDVVFRCNLVAIRHETMWDYSSGHITTEEASQLIAALNEKLGSDELRFFPGTSYRHICRITGHPETLEAVCTPPHDIPDKPIAEYLPKGNGSEYLRDIMDRSRAVLWSHPVNNIRKVTGKTPALTTWLFWGTGNMVEMPAFRDKYGIRVAMTTGVDLLRGLAKMADMTILQIPGVTDLIDNDFSAQAVGAIKALKDHDLVVIHIEAPDEAGHAGSVETKVEAIEKIDRYILSELRKRDDISLLVMPDHATPIEVRTHTAEPIPFLIRAPAFKPNGARRFTESEAKRTEFVVKNGYNIMSRFLGRRD